MSWRNLMTPYDDKYLNTGENISDNKSTTQNPYNNPNNLSPLIATTL